MTDENPAATEAAFIRAATALTGVDYTHWAYFHDEGQARKAATKLHHKFGYGVEIRLTEDGEYLILATGMVPVDALIARHATVGAIVERHGGNYDGGEATLQRGQVNEAAAQVFMDQRGIEPIDGGAA